MSDLSLLFQQLAHWNAYGEIPMRDGREHVVSENPYSVTLRRASVKGGPVLVKAESLVEYDFFRILDFDNRVEKYKDGIAAKTIYLLIYSIFMDDNILFTYSRRLKYGISIMSFKKYMTCT